MTELGLLEQGRLRTLAMTVLTGSRAQERELLAAARGGDEEAFRRLVEPHRSHLHAHCYRMLGSLHDAEDVLQEALLRAWRGLAGFDGRSAFRTWLYRITTNACLDAISRRPRRVLPIDYGPPGGDESDAPPSDVAWVEPYPDEVLQIEEGYASPEARYEQREAVELAFVAALQHLPPRQRAVLILREVLGFSAREAAEALGSTPASVNSALQRARRTVDERIPERSQQATVRSLGDKQVRGIVERFSDAFERGDTAAILALLTEDATFSMPPSASWCRGRAAIDDAWLMPGDPTPRLRYVATRANGQPAVAAYLLSPDGSRYLPLALDVLTLRGALISDVTAFRTPEIFLSFGLPAELAAQRTTASMEGPSRTPRGRHSVWATELAPGRPMSSTAWPWSKYSRRSKEGADGDCGRVASEVFSRAPVRNPRCPRGAAATQGGERTWPTRYT